MFPNRRATQIKEEILEEFQIKNQWLSTLAICWNCLSVFECVSSVQFSHSHVRLFMTPWTAACQASLSITNFHSLLKLMSIKLVMPSNHLILCRPLLLLPSIFPSIRVSSNESALHIRWPKYWSFNTSPSNEHAGLISFRMDWLDLLQPKGLYLEFSPTPQFKSINSSVLSHVQIFVAHGLAMASILEWVAISFSRGSFQPRDWTWVSCIAGRLFYHLSHQGSQNCLRWWLKALYSEHIP